MSFLTLRGTSFNFVYPVSFYFALQGEIQDDERKSTHANNQRSITPQMVVWSELSCKAIAKSCWC